ncbi:hypothetical protein B4065_0303 [Caldibacillus thermoamylovorans]|nr:hypothetical protein B4065_0303 [Caldibacillus thermoamylovorans]
MVIHLGFSLSKKVLKKLYQKKQKLKPFSFHFVALVIWTEG